MSEAHKIELTTVRMTVTPTFETRGSILAGTAEHQLHGIVTDLSITSPASHEEIAALITRAERMCFVMDAIQRPHAIERRVTINGAQVEN